MDKKNRVVLSVFGAVLVGSGIIFGNTFASNTASPQFSVTLAESATLVVPSAPVNLTVEPTASGVFASGNFNVTAYSNSAAGFDVTMSTNSTALTSSTINISTGDFYTIPTLSNDATESNFELNRWGISINSGATFNPLTTGNLNILNENEPTTASGKTKRIDYATKVDFDVAPGKYSTTLNFTITAKSGGRPWIETDDTCHNGGAIGDDSGSQECPTGPSYQANSLLRAFELAYIYNHKPIYVADNSTNTSWHLQADNETVAGGTQVRFAMQDIDLKFEVNGTPYTVCGYAAASSLANSYVDEALVMDLRDGKSYWIAKLEDGRCWMTQNLDHDISTSGTYNDINTDLGWHKDTTTNEWSYYSELQWDSTTQTYSNTPSVTWVPDSGTTTPSNFVYSEDGPSTADPGDYYQRADLSANNTTICDYTTTDCSTMFVTTRSDWEDLHRHVGNFYNAGAGMATNSAVVDDTYGQDFTYTATTSICPRGWRIAYTSLGGYDDNPATNFNDFYTLNNIYNKVNPGDSTGTLNSIAGLAGAPVWLVRAGSLTDSGTMSKPGTVVAFTSSIYAGGEDSASFYYDQSSSTRMDLGGFVLYSSAGQSIRCIARDATADYDY